MRTFNIHTLFNMAGLITVLALYSVCPQKAAAQVQGKDITVTVTPDHADWNYKTGETARFDVAVRKSGTLLPNVTVDYEAGPVMYPTTKKQGAVLKNGTMKHSGTMKQPGFYRLKVKAHVNGKEYEGLCTAAFSPEQVKPYAKCPDDFDEFWSRTLEQARYNDLNPTRRLLPGRCTKDANVYEVSYANNSWNSRIYGILSVPVKAGRYPALLRVPGAGVRPYGGDTYTAPGKCIVLEIGIHGIPVTMEQGVYDNLLASSLNNYWDTNIDKPESNYYKRVITGAVRGVDYIASLPEWDGRTIGVTGSSQGGFLSIAVAALDKRVTFLAAVHDAMCDYEAECHGTAGGWPHYFYNNGGTPGQDALTQAKVKGARYYDGVNFARRIKVPGWYSFGYNDEVVPPTSSYGLYNIVSAPKTLSVYPMTGHYWYQEQWDEWLEWLRGQMGTNKNGAEQLFDRLSALQERGYMAGHQDDPFYGVTWEWEQNRSDILETVGDYPAVMGFDLGGIEVADSKNLDSVPFTRIREEIRRHHERGGVITISWHPRNPVTGGTAWDVTSKEVVKSVLKGGRQHGKFLTWMQRVGDFLAMLTTADGQRIPVIFRPWHENNGSWFWWGQELCSDGEFLGLWNMLQDYLTEERGLDNLLFSYSPNLDGNWTEERFMKRYPGDNRVMLIGEDAYQWGTEEDFKTQLDADLRFISGFAARHGKLLAMTECGFKNMPDSTWWTRVLKPIMDRYPISYFLLWRNYKEEYFGPAPSLPCAADYRKLYSAGNTLFLRDI